MLRRTFGPAGGPLLALAAALATAVPVAARADDNEDSCFAEATDNERIVACSALIDGGKLGKDKLAQAYAARCLAHIQRKAPDVAVTDCTEAIKIDAKDAQTFALRGEAYCQQKDLKNCVADFDEAIRLDPADPSFLYLRGIARADAGDSEGAIVDLTKAIDNDTGSAPAYVRRGQLYEAEGDKARAAADYRKALDIDPYDEATKQRLDAFRK
jgi:tetratricopeptide (TPR) repeat protein